MLNKFFLDFRTRCLMLKMRGDFRYTFSHVRSFQCFWPRHMKLFFIRVSETFTAVLDNSVISCKTKNKWLSITSCSLDISYIKGTIWSSRPTVPLQCRLSNPFDSFWRQNSSLFALALLFSVLNTCGIKVLCGDYRPTSYVNWTTQQMRVRLFSNFLSRSKLNQ